MKWLIVIFIASSMFIGCSTEQYKYVYLPQKCDTEFPPSIQPTDNIVENYANILSRLEVLEYKLHYCRGDTTNDNP